MGTMARKLATNFVVAALATLIVAGVAQAKDAQARNLSTAPVVRQMDTSQWIQLQSRQQRLDFQRQQQVNRELDSLSIRQRQPRIEVPVLKPGCRQLNSGTRSTC